MKTFAALVQGITVSVCAAILTRLQYVPLVCIAPEMDMQRHVQPDKQHHRFKQRFPLIAIILQHLRRLLPLLLPQVPRLVGLQLRQVRLQLLHQALYPQSDQVLLQLLHQLLHQVLNQLAIHPDNPAHNHRDGHQDIQHRNQMGNPPECRHCNHPYNRHLNRLVIRAGFPHRNRL